MWKCRNCREEVGAQLDVCWNCGYSKDGKPPSDPIVFEDQKSEVEENEETPDQGSEVEESGAEENEESEDQESEVVESGIVYDPEIIQKFAKGLYNQADTIVIVYSLVGIVIGFLIGYLLLGSFGFSNNQNGQDMLGGLLGGFIVGAVGYFMGGQRAFGLKLQAQVALCQVQIEENTRHAISASESPKAIKEG